MSTSPLTTPALKGNPLDHVGIETLEARAGEKKKQLKIEREQFFQAGKRHSNLSEELEEIERKISDFDDGICPTCNQKAPEMFASLKLKRTELEVRYRDAHEDLIDRSTRCQDIELEISDIETEVHRIIRRNREIEATP